MSRRITKAARASSLPELELSTRSGVPLSTMRRRLAGDQLWTLAEVEGMAHALNMDPQDLIEGNLSDTKAAS